MQRQEKPRKVYFVLLGLTVLFVAALFLPWGRESEAAPEGAYTVTAERGVSAERIVPEKQLVNINTATAEELETLTGIGPVLARAIVDYRAEHGAFASVDGLLEVSGIGKAKLEGIRDDVTIGGGEG